MKKTDPNISKITGKPKLKRGFAAMPADKLKLIATKGGASVPPHKRSFHRDVKLAARAGAIGGAASRGGGRSKVRAAEKRALNDAAKTVGRVAPFNPEKWDGN